MLKGYLLGVSDTWLFAPEQHQYCEFEEPSSYHSNITYLYQLTCQICKIEATLENAGVQYGPIETWC